MSLAAQLAKFAEKTKQRTADVHREMVIQIANSIVTGSVVGNTDNWLSLNPYSDIATGKSGTRLKGPIGYVGGRFRANWVPGINSVNTDASKEPDAQGDSTIAAITAAIPAPGGVFYITNSLPYARRLEYEGWSSQMPNGVVRITAMRFNEWLQNALNKLGA